MDRRDEIREYGPLCPKNTIYDHEKMQISIPIIDDDEEYIATFPAIYEVCDTCRGRGKHVNPSIDSHGITFQEDPEFAESYFSGVYDTTCFECQGRRVVLMINEQYLSESQKEDLERFHEWQEDEMIYRATCEAERRMGA